jgi:cysteine synthase A
MEFFDGLVSAIGNTPLIRMRTLSEQTGCNILAKAEFLNPGGSVKDRTALFIIRDAEKRGTLRPGGMIVEGSAGNTGIGLATVGTSLGYKVTIVIPETQSQEKKDVIRIAGADLREVPALPYKDPNNYIKMSARLTEELNETQPNGAMWANQFDNLANRQAHYETTGPEIWAQTDGKVDGFICSVGTGGTLSGVAMYLKEKNPNVTIGLADPMGANLYSYYTTGELKSEGGSITEGIGQGRITENLVDLEVDTPFQVTDTEALNMIFDMIQTEGWCLGGSSGINLVGAKRLAEKMGPGHTIVTILGDLGGRYKSKLFNPEFLRKNGLPTPHWLE